MTPKIIYRSKAQFALLQKLSKVAKTSAEILITGPSGVGKELYASYIHAESLRASKPFVAVNCANLSVDMIENEIFGHARGAFTGAVTSTNGLAAAAEGGTLFLDEVDALPFPCQAKLLRFAQAREYRRLGEPHTRKANVRLISASNVDLVERVRCGAFREDLFFRLRVVPVSIPPLSERPEDIPALVEHFVTTYAQEYGVPPVEFGSAARERMQAYGWPGNVRELESCVRYLTCLDLGRPARPDDLPLLALEPPPATEGEDGARPTELSLKLGKSRVIESFERAYIDAALRNSRGNVAEAARMSGKHRRAFFELMRRHGIDAEVFR
ncbi:sigma-54-dependent Fis family transcriptional regulator [Paracoccus liaowanqingii]|uniref:Nif-specific regulatory protein n=1 Tax=Paracoccus liaowanqingii TaxID=2560053 RepID=A0A4P7HLY9_9RHOB|nr:sigma-54 dependent transcriptional regulator [Paracoccus liaowanqingii]QBX35185.1 sigma-54-dependent Fis family transcriptional regulator [Paracoccus liaowanqingii]